MLLEREGFLTELSELLRRASEADGRLLFLAGEAGIGKSELVRAFRTGDAVRASGAQVLVGACDSLSTPRPLGPLLDMATEPSFPLDRQAIAGPHRHEVFATILDHLRVTPKVLVVVFEDVHWADEATLDLLRYLGRRLDGAKALLIASYRDDEVGHAHPLRRLLGDLATTRSFERMRLTRLTPAAVAELAKDTPIDPLALYRRTGGNPFYVTEVVASGEGGVPARVSDAVLARAARLAAVDRTALDACAVIGFRFQPWLVAAVVGQDVDAAASLDRSVQAGMLFTHDAKLGFRHELTREALLEALSFVRKRELHERILAALRAAGSNDLSSLAHHAEGAADGAAIRAYAPAAGRLAQRSGAHREAAAQFARALRFARDLPADEHVELLQAFATESMATDDNLAAQEAWGQALEIRARQGSELERAKILAFLAHSHFRQGHNQRMRERMATALEILEGSPPSVEHGFVRAYHANFLMLERDNRAAITEGERALALALEYDDRPTQALAYDVVGSARILLGEYERGEQDLLQCLRTGRELERDDHVANAYVDLGSALGEMYRFERAEAYLQEGIAFCSERDLDFSQRYMESWLALTWVFTGAWDEAEALAGEVLRRPRASPITRIMALVALGRLRARRGDGDPWPELDEALELAERTATLQRVAPVRAARAEARFLAGESEQAAIEAAACYDLARAHEHPWHVGELAYWQHAAEQAFDLGRQEPATIATPYAHEFRGDLTAAAAAWEALGCPYEMARTLSASALNEPLERARVTLQGLGAEPLLKLVTAKMRTLGYPVPRGPAALTAANPANLTKREAEIVKLVAQGLTNQEIAERLYRSVRTVDHHVSAILAKLEVGNRLEAAQKATRLGLVDEGPA